MRRLLQACKNVHLIAGSAWLHWHSAAMSACASQLWQHTCIAAVRCSACARPVWRCWTALSAPQFPVVPCLSRLQCTSASSEQSVHPEFFNAIPPAPATANGAAADSKGPDRICACARRCSSSATLRLAAERTVAPDIFLESPITRAGCHCSPDPDCIGRWEALPQCNRSYSSQRC